MAERSRPTAPASISEPPSPSSCRWPPTRPNRRPIPMTEPAPVVLVIDDEIQIRRFLRAGLELDGFVVQEAETGTDAMRAGTLTPPDLVILDLGLPDRDAADVLEQLRG